MKEFLSNRYPNRSRADIIEKANDRITKQQMKTDAFWMLVLFAEAAFFFAFMWERAKP